ncbi:MAG: hypothetical protein GY913_12465 [Proteobacteria bacterium]|nr:hypothetical protein [Pseudomonadota bacterium]
MSIQASKQEQLRYQFDTFLAKGSRALFVALTVAFFVALLAIGVVRFFFWGVDWMLHDEVTKSLSQGIWFTWLQLTDPGNMAQDNETFVGYKITAIIAGMTGVVIFSALIAFLTTALDQAIDDLKKGHSRVLETGHTLIVGWGPRVPEILRELVEANESEDDPVAVILAEEEKEDMDEHLRELWTDRRNLRLVTRSGPTAGLGSLAKVSAEHAASAIVLATCGEAASQEDKLSSDAKVIKTVLAIIAHVGDDAEINIVAEVFDERNRAVVKDIAPDRISVIDSNEILAKIMVQTSRTSGLSVVYAELLSFEGCEMYFHNDEWNGITFGALQFHFPDGVPIGIRKPDGSIAMRTDPDYVMADDDEILIIADDDSTIEFESSPVMKPKEMPLKDMRIEPAKERMLILGWSPKVEILISEYSDYVLEGSEVHLMIPSASDDIKAVVEDLNSELDNASVTLIDKDPMSSEELATVDPFSYNVVIILKQNTSEDAAPERVDSETIIVLLHLRKLLRMAMADGRDVNTKLITEVLDSSNQELISRAGVDDFIISNRMVSMMFAQISCEPDIQDVYDDLFQEDGSEIYVKPAWLYFDELPVTCRFGDLMQHVRGRDTEICIGYKIGALETDADENFGVKLIPLKDSMVTLGPGDGLVVVAEDDM